MSRRRRVVVVSDLRSAAGLPEDQLVAADEYLEGGGSLSARGCTVVNLCNSYRNRSRGYYVSLLADARGQSVVPSVETIEGVSDAYRLFRALHEAGVPTVDAREMRARRRRLANGAAEASARRALIVRNGGAHGPELRTARPEEQAESLAFFGRTPDPRFRSGARAVFREWPMPSMRIRWMLEEEEWKVIGVEPAPLRALDEEGRAELARALRDERLLTRRPPPSPVEGKRAALAVLVDEGDPFSPSSPETVDRLERVAAKLNVFVRRISMDDLEKLGEYDALFIRALTGVSTPAFQFALRAEALGMPVIDDSQSIIRCGNKVFLEELLRREGLATPRTMIASARTPVTQVAELGYPFVIKLPEGSFSAEVHRIESAEAYQERAGAMFRRSPLIIAQEYLPTDFDWRITVLDGEVLFAARYHMARGHWQIRASGESGERYGRVEAVPRGEAPAAVVELARRSAALIGRGLYGVDLKETPRGPVVIEINDNPNLDAGYDDAADGIAIYEDIVHFFLRRVEERPEERPPRDPDPRRAAPSTRTGGPRRHYRPFEVAGVELEYAVVDGEMRIAHVVEDAFRSFSGRATSDVQLGEVGFSNEIADHVLELKTLAPPARLADAEDALFAGLRRFSELLRTSFGARLLPTGMHPLMDPREAHLWTRSGSRIYQAYARLFDVRTHGWMNVHAAHLNLPLGRESEGTAMYNASALLIPYLPAIAASSPVHDGVLREEADARLTWILRHQREVPESCGDLVPERVEGFTDYRKRILAPMYEALDASPDSEPLRHEFFNARAAVLKFSRRAMELRVLDTQECIRMDLAVMAFARAALRSLTAAILAGKTSLPPHALLVEDFRGTIRDGSAARVHAPHLSLDGARGDDGKVPVKAVLGALLDAARVAARREDAEYLDLAERVMASGSLSERIRSVLEPSAGDPESLEREIRRVYGELMDCLEENRPWPARW